LAQTGEGRANKTTNKGEKIPENPEEKKKCSF
jgi:hypothetical protein